MGFYRIVNWAQFQHYKDRSPPWIKLHRSMLSSRTWVKASDSERVLAVACMLVAADTENKIPDDPDYVRRVAYLQADPDFKPLVDLKFIEFVEENENPIADASESQASASKCYSEERRGEERREEARARATPKKTREEADPPPGLNPAAWSRWVGYRTEIRKPLKAASIPAAQKALAAYGRDQQAVVEQSIANGWQGLFALKDKPKGQRSSDGAHDFDDAFEVARRTRGS